MDESPKAMRTHPTGCHFEGTSMARVKTRETTTNSQNKGCRFNQPQYCLSPSGTLASAQYKNTMTPNISMSNRTFIIPTYISDCIWTRM